MLNVMWYVWRGQRIFVTGGTGFVGCWLLESLLGANRELNSDIQVTILTRDSEAFQERHPHLACDPSVRFHCGDVRSFDFPAGAFDGVIHAAADTAPSLYRDEPRRMLETLVEGTRRTLDLAVRCREI